MRQEDVDFDQVDEIDAEALGAPGQRTFRIRARKGTRTASLWLEKQQLQALCFGMRQKLEEEPPGHAPASLPMIDFPSQATTDFRIGQLALGWDQERQQFVLQARPLEADGDAPAVFRCRADRLQATAFCDLSEAICAAGRPVCFLCGEPIDSGGHACVRSNGHLDQEIPAAD